MTCLQDTLLEYEPGEISLRQLTVRIVRRDEFDRAGAYFDQQHYLDDLRSGVACCRWLSIRAAGSHCWTGDPRLTVWRIVTH